MKRLRILGLVTLLAALPAQTPTPLTTLQSRGFVLKAHRTALGLTQSQLAVLSGVSATKISRIERGLDSATVAQEDAIALPLDSIIKARLAPGTSDWMTGVVVRIRSRQH